MPTITGGFFGVSRGRNRENTHAQSYRMKTSMAGGHVSANLEENLFNE
jgi:hypothetical protein